MRRIIPVLAFSAAAIASAQVAAALTVTSPATTVVVAAGNDYATQVLGDPWDMSDAADLDTDESFGVTSQTFAGGVFTGSATSCSGGASLYPLFPGYGPNTVATNAGRLTPIDTSIYRYFTVKVKDSTAQLTHMIFYDTNTTFGSTRYKSVAANAWSIQTWDLQSAADVFTTSPPLQTWTAAPNVQGIRFDPCNSGGASLVNVNWIRLTAPPDANQQFTVTWSDTSNPPYTVSAIDSDGVAYTFTTNASGTSYLADFSRLPPGDYVVQVSRSGASANSPGVIRINAPAIVDMTSPSKRGEQSKNYALTQLGNAWGPIDMTDFNPSPQNFASVSYSGGVLTGRPVTAGMPGAGDTQFPMNLAGRPINAGYYRSACFTMEVHGTRVFSDGWIARLLWANTLSNIAATTDIVVNTGLNEYCFADLADTTNVPLVAASPPPPPWAGNMVFLRFDPDEIQPPAGCNTAATCHDIQLNSIILAPWASANPGYTFAWTMTTDKASIQLTLALDPDTNPNNGNQTVIYQNTVGNGNGTFAWNGAGGPAPGTYNLLATTNDGTNVVSRYASGKIIVASTDKIFANGFETN